jgi:hypothetical protein
MAKLTPIRHRSPNFNGRIIFLIFRFGWISTFPPPPKKDGHGRHVFVFHNTERREEAQTNRSYRAAKEAIRTL